LREEKGEGQRMGGCRERERERERESERCQRQLLNVLAVIDLKPTKLLVDKV